MLGGGDVGDVDGFSFGATARHRLPHRRHHAACACSTTTRSATAATRACSATAARRGSAPRCATRSEHRHRRARVFADFWGELGVGFEHVAWLHGGVLDRPERGARVRLRSRRPRHARRAQRRTIGYFMDFRTHRRAGARGCRRDGDVRGPCTTATTPPRSDVCDVLRDRRRTGAAEHRKDRDMIARAECCGTRWLSSCLVLAACSGGGYQKAAVSPSTSTASSGGGYPSAATPSTYGGGAAAAAPAHAAAQLEPRSAVSAGSRRRAGARSSGPRHVVRRAGLRADQVRAVRARRRRRHGPRSLLHYNDAAGRRGARGSTSARARAARGVRRRRLARGRARRRCRPHPARLHRRRPHARDRRGWRALQDRRAQRHDRALRDRRVGRRPRRHRRQARRSESPRLHRRSARHARDRRLPHLGFDDVAAFRFGRVADSYAAQTSATATSASSGSRSSPSAARCGRRPSSRAAIPRIRSRRAATRFRRASS